jgi:hypothetical protein
MMKQYVCIQISVITHPLDAHEQVCKWMSRNYIVTNCHEGWQQIKVMKSMQFLLNVLKQKFMFVFVTINVDSTLGLEDGPIWGEVSIFWH